jgi:hypothetical protein
MALDPNVQVALVSVFATTITTLGVIAVAVINNRKERTKAADAGVEAGLDEKDVLSRILALISENDVLEKQVVDVTAERDQLKDTVRQLQAEVVFLRLGHNIDDPDGGADV